MRFNRRCLYALLVVTLPTSGLRADDALLVVGGVKVRTTKADGRSSWDSGGGAPDIKISVERTSEPRGERHITASRKDCFEATFNRRALGVDVGDVIEILVLDEDLTRDDEIGKTSCKVTATMLKSGEIKFSSSQMGHHCGRIM